ncbi:uncharacterized protein ColSpa_12552 [Colletotrichum spaethianum]|uniref:Uncharacterized protein n=1 Tax=Colletotrichum spaethianum TaxID=700344 RepID=A0AA37PHD7_9PEZI|nr:uncharacterized protein ColSpa_12552 [Colletotrichum spaethianum]GKT52371.1 hypothetical protein ColSpa_12552 [Colletotrichum spaethianum]
MSTPTTTLAGLSLSLTPADDVPPPGGTQAALMLGHDKAGCLRARSTCLMAGAAPEEAPTGGRSCPLPQPRERAHDFPVVRSWCRGVAGPAGLGGVSEAL